MFTRTTIALLILAIAAFSGCTGSTLADKERAATKPSVAPEQALKEAAGLYKDREDPEKVRKALETLSKARDPNNRNFEVESTFAKYSWFLGSREQLSAEQAEEVLDEGLEAAKIARRLDPEKPDGHFWEAAIIGEQAQRAPVTVGIVSIDKIRAGMQKVLEIDPGFQSGSAYLGLGRLELNSRGLAGGSAEKAVEYLEKGYENHKDNAYIYRYLAEAYFVTDQDEKAKEVISKLRALEPDPDYMPEYKQALKEAEELLKQKS